MNSPLQASVQRACQRNTTIVLAITRACYNQCNICCTDSSPRAPSMDFNLLKEITNKLTAYQNRHTYIKKIFITGGEALLYKSGGLGILDVINQLQVINCRLFVRTTGWRANNCFGTLLSHIKKTNLSECVEIGTSFNLYLPNVGVNFQNTISRVFDILDIVNVQVAVSPANILETLEALCRCLEKLKFVDIPPAKELTSAFYIDHSLHFRLATNGLKALTIDVFPVVRVGRAKKYIRESFSIINRSCNRRAIKQLVISCNGMVFACDSVFARQCPSIHLGHILEHSIEKLMETRNSHFARLSESLEALSKEGFLNVCEFCQTIQD